MLGAMFGATFITLLGLPWFVGAALAMLVVAVLALVEEKIAVAPVLNRSATGHGWVITTLAVSMILANLVGLGWGPDPIAVRPPAPLSTETFELLGANISSYQIAVMVITVVLVLGVEAFYGTRSGKAVERDGTRSGGGSNAPSGLYPCAPGGANDYVWIMTSRANPEHWARLCKVMGREELINDPRFTTPDERVKNNAALDEIIVEWTRTRTKHEAMQQVGSASIPAGAVFDTMELMNDKNFDERGIMQVMEHPSYKPFKMPAWPVIGDVLNTLFTPLLSAWLVRTDLTKAFAPDKVPKSYLRHALAEWTRPRKVKWYSIDDALLNASLAKFAPHYAELRVPVVIVTGDSDLIVPAQENAFRLAAALPQANLRILERTGHQIPLVRPDAVRECVELVARLVDVI
jgi:hypothetical protein